MNYLALAELYQSLEATTKRLEKTRIVSEFLKTVDSEYIPEIMLLVQGKVFPSWDDRKMGLSTQILIKVLHTATGADSVLIEGVWRDTGDLGKTAERLCSKKTQATLFSESLTVDKVFSNLQKLASIEGEGTVDKKVSLVAELLTNAKPLEAKYIVRTVLEDLRCGLGEGTLRDAIVWAYFGGEAGVIFEDGEFDVKDRVRYNTYVEAVQSAYDLANDFGIVAKKAKEGLDSLHTIAIEAGKPVKAMLYQKAADIPEAFSIVGMPAAFEYKYDGFRMMIHKAGGKIRIFTRKLEEVTKQFPEVISLIEKYVKGDSYIIDAEAVGFDPQTKKYVAFQKISQRIKRKHDISLLAKQFPVEINVFDVLYYNGETMIPRPFLDRRKLLEKIVSSKPYLIAVAKQIITEDPASAAQFYDESLAAGNEGVMAKNLKGVYKPGSRVGYGVKVKPVMESLDVVIVGGEWGEGKRSKWIASFIVAVRTENGELLEIGRVGTGFKEKTEEGVSFAQLTDELKPAIIQEAGRIVKVRPSIIIEVNYEEIQQSPSYTSGFALRFPRFTRLREDRSVDDISTLEDVKRLYEAQRNRN